MSIDYTKVIRGCVEPRLAYHGFKYNEQASDPPAGFFRFTRQFFGKSQYVEIMRHRYLKADLAEVRAKGIDTPTRVHLESEEKGERSHYLWLSNRYILAGINHEGASHTICHGPLDEGAYLWEYHAEGDLRRALKGIVEVVLTEGLDWFEEKIAETRRHHEKLDARRIAEKERRGHDIS